MIEDKNLNLKIAINKEEQILRELKEKIEKDIIENKISNEINEIVLKHLNEKLKIFDL